MASIYDANTNYRVTGTDLRANPGLVTREYLIDLYPTFIDNFRFAGLWLWGGLSFSKSSPVQTVSGGTNWKQVSYFSSFVAIKTDGTLWTWGDINSTPVNTVATGTNWKQASKGYNHTAAIKTDGTLWLWGDNTNGQLGNNTTTNNTSPVQTVSGGTNWKQVSCGSEYTAAIKTDGTLWLWGFNFNGELGTNNRTYRSSPVQTVSGGTNWKQVSTGGGHTAAIKTDGTLWLWGSGFAGQLGNNFSVDRSSPVQTVSGGTNWKQISASKYAITAAIKTDGTLWVWGKNTDGQLGDGTTTDKSSPVQTVSGGTNWKQVSCGYDHTAAIKTDGTLWSWGLNSYGQLGDNTRTSTSSPIQTIAGGTNWKQVDCGSYSTSTIRDDSSDPFRAEPL